MLNCIEYTKKRSFEDILLEAIDETLNALGETVKTAIYFHLKDTFNIKKTTSPKEPDFSDALASIFGFGARYLETMFIKNLYYKTKVKQPSNYYLMSAEATFSEYVLLARQNFESMRKNEDKIVLPVFPPKPAICPITLST